MSNADADEWPEWVDEVLEELDGAECEVNPEEIDPVLLGNRQLEALENALVACLEKIAETWPRFVGGGDNLTSGQKTYLIDQSRRQLEIVWLHNNGPRIKWETLNRHYPLWFVHCMDGFADKVEGKSS